MAFLNTTTFPSPTPQEVSQIELGYIDGLTSNAQTQLDGKLPLPGGTTSQILLGTGAPASAVPAAALLAANMPTGIDAAKLADGSVSNVELQYINSLTSNAQTQLDANAAAIAGAIQYATTGGSAGSWTLTAPGVTNSDGQRVFVKFGTAPSVNDTLSVNGLTARKFAKNSQAGASYITGGEILTGVVYELAYSATNLAWMILGSFKLQTADVPWGGVTLASNMITLGQTGAGLAAAVGLWGNASGDAFFNAYTGRSVNLAVNGSTVASFGSTATTLGATNFSGTVSLTDSSSPLIRHSASDKYLALHGGSSNPAIVILYSNGHATKAAIAEYYTGDAVGGKHQFFVGASHIERARMDVTGLCALSPVIAVPTGGAWTTLCAITGNQALRFATVQGHGTALLEWDGTTLTKLAGVSTLVVAGSAGATEVALRVSGGNLQASNGTGADINCSSGFSVRH